MNKDKNRFSFNHFKRLLFIQRIFMRSLLFVLIILSLIFAKHYGFCDESEPIKQTEAKTMVLQKELSVKEAITLALENNMDVMVDKFNPRIKGEDITNEKAKFDPTYYLKVTTDVSLKPSGSSLAGADVVVNKNLSWDTGFKGKILSGATYSLDFTNKRTRTNSSFSSLNPQYVTEIKLNVTQPLLKNFGIDVNSTDIKIAKNNKDISLNQFKDTVMTTISDVENTYWDLVFSIEDYKVNQLSLKRAEDFLERTKKQVEVGTLAPIDITEAEAEVAKREEGIIIAEANIKNAEDKIKRLINIKGDDNVWETQIIPTDQPVFAAEDFNLEECIKTAFTRRPDYLQALADLENKEIALKFAKNQLLPSLDFIGSLGYNGLSGKKQPSAFGNSSEKTFVLEPKGKPKIIKGEKVYEKFSLTEIEPEPFDRRANPLGESYEMALQGIRSRDNFSWLIGLQLEIPLGNRAAKSNFTKKTLDSEKAVTGLSSLRQKITVEMRNKVRDVRTNLERIKATRKARELAVKKLEAEEKKYEVGMSTNHQVLEFQEDLAAAEANELKAVIDYNKSLISVEKSKGTILEKNEIKLDNETNI